VQRRRGDASIVDVVWTAGLGLLALLYALVLPGAGGRRVLVTVLVVLWSARLASHLLRDRVIGTAEDGRYREMRRQWGARAQAEFFWYFQAQALAAVFFAIPALMPALNPDPTVTPLEWAAVLLWMVAVAGESTADWQLTRFKRRAGSRGRTCRDGLWHYSRHPNYFFEWLVWVAYALFASASPVGLVAIACPAVMLFLLFRITGIPATEAQAVLSRGDDYRDYQATTSAFVPWFPRESAVRS
jgi:steroid 5-alpha reductase family enzyme